MAIDMSQFYQVFFEEAQEHLASMESLLLAIDPVAPDSEDVNAVFRAAHSIKGSSATFGFNDLTEVTHVMENLLDRVRKQEQALSDEIVDACLKAGDVLKNLLAAHQGQETADREAADAIRARLSSLMDAGPAAVATVAGNGKSKLYSHQIAFLLQCTEAEYPAIFDNLLVELRNQGEVRVEQRGSVGEERAEARVQIDTVLDEESLKTLLAYVVDASSLRVIKASADDAPDGDEAYGFFGDAPAAKPSEEAYGFFDEPAPEAASAKTEEAYGFFDTVEPAPVSSAQEKGVEAADGSYGIFDITTVPAANKPAENTAAATPAKADTHNVSAITAAAESGKVAARSPHSAAHSAEAGSIRVSVDKVDQMINLVGELVITQAMLAQAASKVDPVVFEDLLNSLTQLERNTRDLQESVMSVRMLPISTVFSRFPRVVRDLSQKLNKKVQLVLSGEHTELDKTLIERITDPLTHLVRNSLDHGIEMPETRAASGKVEQGTINLRAYHQSGNIVIEVSDDGAGLRREKILSKARERGLPVNDSMSDQEVWMLIFEPGFSTADVVTDVSGRGVGMDVVRKNIAALNGRIEIDSVAGVGTRTTVRLPLTLAILDGMSVGVGDETYIIPLDYVVESLQPSQAMMKSVSGNECLLQVRGEYLPVISLRELFGIHGNDPSHVQGIMVVVESDGVKAALFVEELIGQHQVVIKSLEANYRRVPGVAGATIMGDGHVALIVDAAAVVGMARRVMPVAA